MAKKFELQIPDACHESWDKMTPGDKGRFCDSCQKVVHDFTGMSDAQLIAFFKNPSTGSVCGRFYNEQLNRDFEIPRKRIPWLRYFLQMAIPAFLFSSKAKSQGKPIIVGDTVKCESPKVSIKQITLSATGEKIDSNKITGRVVDSRGQALPSSSVIIKETRQGTVSTINGSFKIQPDENWEKITLVVSYIGFLTQEIVVRRGDNQKEIIVSLDEQMLGQVVTVGAMIVRKKKSPKPLIQRIFKDTTFKFFKIYPNPVVAGASVNLELKKAEPSEYNVDLINMSGQIVYSGVQRFESKNETNSFNIPYIVAGGYLLQLANKKSGKKYTEKIIIQ
jgi:CarboxypepD_reg-like domain/Secretion system C-terminal sorting domain